jgi:hypothetical protein
MIKDQLYIQQITLEKDLDIFVDEKKIKNSDLFPM